MIIFPSISQAESLALLSKELAKGASSLKTKKVAVLTFPYHDGRLSSGSTIVSERLTTGLVGKRGIRVIERRLIEKLMSEEKLSQSGVINADSLKTIGTVLEADAIVTGTLIDMPNGKTEINARLIRVDTGEMLAASQETIERTWKDNPCFPETAKPAPAPYKDEVAAPAPEPAAAMEPLIPMAEPTHKMRFSNESFPEGRRNYYANDPPPHKKPKKVPLKYDAEERDEYQDFDDYRAGPPPPNPAGPTKKEAGAFTPTLQHPTAVGAVRSDSRTVVYPGATGRRSRKR